jgi:5-methylcytosine-specific restriction protein A
MRAKVCKHPGCQKIAGSSGYCPAHERYGRDLVRERDTAAECRQWAYLYNSERWKLRRARQLAREPLCRECLTRGIYTLGTVADHIEDHKGDPAKFFYGALQTLCPSCHSAKTARENNPKGDRG